MTTITALTAPPRGARVHYVDDRIVGWDAGDVYARNLDSWGGYEAERICDALVWAGWTGAPRLTPAGTAAQEWNLRDDGQRDPPWVARLTRPRYVMAGLAGGVRGEYALTYRYDITSAYPAAALEALVPDWSRGVLATTGAETARYLARGYVGVADCEISNAPAGLLLAGPWPATATDYRGVLTTVELHAALDAGARLRRVHAAALAPGRAWDWYLRVFDRLWNLRQRHPEAGRVYKLAANGLIGRMAASARYMLVVAGGARQTGPLVSTADGGLAAGRVILSDNARGARSWITAALIVAAVRVRLWRDVQEYGAVWWYTDTITTTTPLPPAAVGHEPGLYRLVGAGPSRIIDWRGGRVAGAPLIASLARSQWAAVLSAADS